MRANRWLRLSTLLLALGCGAGGATSHPDTGAGAGQTPPATENCADLCQRIATCAVTLCNEDTMSQNYDGAEPSLAARCLATCTDERVQTSISSGAWQCIFLSSCRQVFEHDACTGMSAYSC